MWVLIMSHEPPLMKIGPGETVLTRICLGASCWLSAEA